jgi:hypothetical protein
MTRLLQRKPSASCHKAPTQHVPCHWQSDEETLYTLLITTSCGHELESERNKEQFKREAEEKVWLCVKKLSEPSPSIQAL